MLQDLKSAFRSLLKARWFTCVTVLTLALGIGANTAIFGVVNRLLLNPLPYPDAERLVYLSVGGVLVTFTFPAPSSAVKAWRDEARSLDGIEAYSQRETLAYDDNGARLLTGVKVTAGLPALLGITPVLGRTLTPADADAGAPAVVMLSYGSWQRDYGGSPTVLGRAITLDDVSHVIVGVLPPRSDAFIVGGSPDVWLPLSLDAPAVTSLTEFQPIEVLARLPPGATPATVKPELDTLLARALAAGPRTFFGDEPVTTAIERPADRIGGEARDALLVLLGAVALVLLVACSNVANLLLARGASSARELSLRSALGASTWRLVRALFVECFVLASMAGAVGVALGWLTLRVLARVRPATLSQVSDVQLDGSVLAFTFGVSIATALLFGLAPALQLTSRKLGDALRHGTSGVVRGGSGARVRKLLVAAQMAVSVVLLVSAGLLVRSFINLQRVEAGFDTQNLFSMQLSLPRERYREPTSRELLAEQVLERARGLPSVAGVTQSHVTPGGGLFGSGNLEIRGVALSDADARGAHAFNYVRPDYFSVLGIRMLEGRTFTLDELANGRAVIVNRAAEQRYWPDGRSLGTELKIGQDWLTVVGVVDTVVLNGAFDGALRSTDTPQFYFPFAATRTPTALGATPSVLLIARARTDPANAIAALRGAIQELDREIATPNVVLTETELARTLDGPRFNMALLTAFAVIALVLAAVGLAAVIGYEVTERTHEFGIRIALGARTENVLRLAMRHGLTPALLGVVVGVLGALGATQLAASLLYGVPPRDPLTLVGVVALLMAVALGASWLPARRATRVDPIAALRAD
jgi:putative ABC transport system permease protein